MKWTIFGAMVVLAMTMSATAAPEDQKSPLLRLHRRGFNMDDFLDNSAARAKGAPLRPVTDPKPATEAVAGPVAVPGPPPTPGVPA
ncbi:hypothetical protein BGZ93_000366 [Podila epicladia]|nr:hypothetical protein BGZ92_001216 [Podila epicladia]KAG0098348.1 hypothetical protein BGZ93_000366 [Podila epicladia]